MWLAAIRRKRRGIMKPFFIGIEGTADKSVPEKENQRVLEGMQESALRNQP